MISGSARLWACSTAALAVALAAPAAAQTTGTSARTNETPLSTPAADPGAAQTTTPEQRATGPATTSPARAAAGSAAEDEITVTGVRASLIGAQAIKRKSVQVVDSIVAEDIGKLPDNTVSDALQRVTGIQVTRAAGEAASVQLRGLPDVETYINGRETFTGTGRGVALADIPAELVAGIDVYKTLNPEQIEGAIAGAIDIRLRRPLDFDGLRIAGGGRGIYGDQIGKWSYVGSGLISDRWTTAGGQEFGVLVGASYNRRHYNDQIGFNFGFNCPVQVAGVCTTNPANPNAGQNMLIPDTVGGQDIKGDRRRIGGNVSLQWKPTPNLEFHVDGLFTEYKNDYDIDFFVGLPKAGLVTAATAQPGSNVAQTGNLIAGTITTVNNFTISSKQTYAQKTDNYQANAGGSYTSGIATISSEFTYNKSEVRSQQFVLDTFYIVPRIDYNFNANGTPSINFNGFNYRDPSILTLSTLFDNANSANSTQYAGRSDISLDLGSGLARNFKIGVRYAHRTGDSGGTNGTGFPLGNLPGSMFPGFATNSGNDILDGRLGIDGFALASSGFIRDNITALRGYAGLPASGHAYDPSLVFNLKEDNYAGYAQLGFGVDAGSVPITGVFGLRVVNTVTSLGAFQTAVGPTGVVTVTPISGRSNYLDLLPSFTLKAQLRDNVVFRLVGSKSILRPQFAQLDPATSLTQLGITGGTFGSGSGGNANLTPVKSDNLDGTLEWYFSNTGSITAGLFYKRLNGYIQSYANPETFIGSSGLPQTFLITRPQNSGKGTLKGVEVGYQQFFDFLPGPFSGFGAQANFTLAQGDVDSPPNAAGVTTKQSIINTSKYSYNLVGIYEKYGFSARLAYNWRSSYTDSYSQAYAGGRIVVSPIGYLDFSASYAVNDAITLTFDATNLTKATYRDSFGTSGFTPRDTRRFDRTFGGGLRFKF